MKTNTRNETSKVGDITQQWLAIAGIVAPILYISVATILGLLEPGYSHRTMMMSILGGVGGLRGAAFNIGLTLTGTLLIAFAFGLQRGIKLAPVRYGWFGHRPYFTGCCHFAPGTS